MLRALHDSNGWPVSLEFSLAALFPSGPRDLRGGGLASKAGVNDPGYSGAWTRRFDRRLSVDLPHSWFVRFSAHLDCYWTGCGLGFVWNFSYAVPILDRGRPPRSHFARSSPHISASRQNSGVPRYNFSQELLKPEPLDPHRLYLSVYPWAELTYCIANKPQPVGQTLRPGSTSMWAGLRFINGYSPIRAAGVAREFTTSIHGEINPEVGSNLLNRQAGPEAELALLGVDGIVVAREVNLAPQPPTEWELVVSTDEGNVFHRRGAPFARVRSVTSIDSRPNEQFASATVANIDDSRNRVQADVDVPTGDRPALVTFSRPYFRGYKARLGDQKLAVTSYRGLFPVVEVPAGTKGRLALSYRPPWLIWGSAVAFACLLAMTLGSLAAWYSQSRNRCAICLSLLVCLFFSLR